MAPPEPRIVEKGWASDSLVIATVGNRLGVPVKEYLADVLPGVDPRPMSQVADRNSVSWLGCRPPLTNAKY